MYPLLYRKNGQILNQILNDPDTRGRGDPEIYDPDHDFTKREVLEQLVPHATQWISNEMLDEAVCDYAYDTLEDYQANGHPGATEQEFLDDRKVQLATLIAHNYGVFENTDGSGQGTGIWAVQAGEIRVIDNGVITDMQVDMRLFWFFFEHDNAPIVHDKTVKPSDRLTAYQNWFLNELKDSGLLIEVNTVAALYIDGLSAFYSLQDMLDNGEFVPFMFWYAHVSHPVISEAERET
ncbi:hypothetical protein [Candidatus Lokiarchaeum ossiferum]|uniref:hypothetical protein n=1 Tax=Candidatus Lokiarchaeum ossiferum TaxID=2951803 RepID=UPI00352E7C83